MRKVSQQSCRENQNTHFFFSNVFQKTRCLRNNVEKYCAARQATDDNMVHEYCMLDT